MRQFTDSKKRQWEIDITVATVRRVRDLLKIDIPGLIGDGMKPLGELTADPVRLVDLLYVLCCDNHPTHEARTSDQDFGEAMGGDAIGAATDAFLEALVDFFPPRVRAGLRAEIALGWRLTDEVLSQRAGQIEGLDVKAMARKLIGSSGNAPASSASTPAPSPSDNSS